MTSLRAAIAAALTFALATSISAPALADKVAVLAFSQASSAGTKEGVDAARTATRTATIAAGHTLPTDSEMLTAEMAVKDGVPDTSDEYRAAGRASGSAWTVSGRVDPRASGRYRLELEVCQVPSGRVESLAREIDPAQAPQQIAEMLALLVRPEGLANADIPWEHASPQPTPPPTPPPAPPPKPSAPATPPPPPPKPEPKHTYAEGHPIAVGASLEVLGAVARPSNAQGSSVSLDLGGSFGYAIDAVPGLELRADVAGAIVGPQALLLDGGARYAFMIVPAARVYAGPELGLGAFVTLGAEKSGRFLGRGGAVAGIGIGPQAQVELVGDLDWSPGGAGALLLAGVGARGLVRF